MKKLLFILLISCTSFANAQLKFISENKEDMRTLADSIATNTRIAYTFSQEFQHPKVKDYYVISYVSNTDTMNVFYKVYMTGANKDLEIEGTPKYYFSIVEGKFLDLYPFWNKFISSEHSAEQASKKGTLYAPMHGRNIWFKREGDKWTIAMP